MLLHLDQRRIPLPEVLREAVHHRTLDPCVLSAVQAVCSLGPIAALHSFGGRDGLCAIDKLEHDSDCALAADEPTRRHEEVRERRSARAHPVTILLAKLRHVVLKVPDHVIWHTTGQSRSDCSSKQGQ